MKFSFIHFFIYTFFISFKLAIQKTLDMSSCEQGKIYNPITQNCDVCNYTGYNNICYSSYSSSSTNILKSAYEDINKTCTAYNCECNNTQLLAEQDSEGNLVPVIYCADLSLPRIDNHQTYFSQDVEINDLSKRREFSIYVLNSPYRRTSTMQGKQPFVPTYYSDDNIYYHFYACKYAFVKESCQYFGNLCALAMYESQNIACIVLDYFYNKDIFNENYLKFYGYNYMDENKQKFPHLVKFNSSENLEFFKAYKFDYTEASFDKEDNEIHVNEFDLYLAKWDINGSFLGFEPIKNELILCTKTYNDTRDFRSFGSTIINECEINIENFYKTNYKTVFYQMYIKVQKSNGAEREFEEYPIPVIVDNYQENNQLDIEREDKTKKLFKRFFLVFNELDSENIIYAKNITLKGFLLDDKDGVSKINMPILEIYYHMDAKGPLKVSFVSDYTMDLDKIMRGLLAFLIIAVVITVIVVILRMRVWVILNPPQFSMRPGDYCPYALFHLLVKIFKYFGIMIFIWSFGLAIYWYIFFKLQYRPYVLLPSFYEIYKVRYKKFNIIWGLACTMYGLYMFYRIYEQVSCDVFFIDWEHEKNILISKGGEITSKPYKGPWRMIHVINQYNLMQKSRTISIPFCFCWLIFLWYYPGTRWYEYAQVTPNKNWVEKSPENIILRHFMGTFILFVSGVAQYAVVRLLQLWIPMKKTDFLDLCSVANISVIIFQESLRGYYIHGQSPLGIADTNLHQLVTFLEEEGKGKIRGRGLVAEDKDDLQTYEVYLSYDIRNVYDGYYNYKIISEIDDGHNRDAMQTQGRLTNIFKYVPNSLNVDYVFPLYQFMNNHLRTKIEQAATQPKIHVKDKSICERFFRFPPRVDLFDANKGTKELFFYRDPGANFEDVCFTGMELEWLIFIIYWWQMWCIALDKYKQSFPIAVFMSYVVEKIFSKIRIYFGERNVARRSVIDNRFL